MRVIPTRVYKANILAYLSGKKRRALNEGGTTSSKTHSILSLLIYIAQNALKPLIISITSESLPHLRRGCIRDFVRILGDEYDDNKFNKSEHIYNFGNAIMEFFPADDPTKMRGSRRDILFINEANNVSYDAYRELDIRTSRFTFLDWNPTCEFWAHTEGLIDDPLTEFIHSTYLDVKEVLHNFDEVTRLTIQAVIDNIESNRDKDPNWWNVYGLGKVGNIEGLVHPHFVQVDSMPDSGMSFFGLDFGFTNDPTALVHNKIVGDCLYSDVLIYQNGLTNQEISNYMQSIGVRKHYDEIFADCAEPKSIEEIRLNGWNIKASPKGADSVMAGIQLVNQYKQHWTKRSVDGIKEMRNYRYITDRDGRITNKPIDAFDHAIQARQYGVVGKLRSMQTQTTGMLLKI